MRSAVIVLLSAAIAACGTGPVGSQDDTSQVSADLTAPSDRLYVMRADGLSVINAATGTVERELPAGILSPDRSAYWTVDHAAGTTTVRKLDPASGLELDRLQVPGAFELPREYGPLADALSQNGRYLVLRDASGASAFSVLDLKERKERARAILPGRFTFDAIDEIGSSVYLLEHPQPSSDKYNVRFFDVFANALSPQAIVDAKAAQPSAADLARGTMGGIYHASTTAGQWHFGLYTSSTKGPTIHALNVASRWALCLVTLNDDPKQPAAWAIVPSPRGDRVYAINAATGRFASIAADSLETTSRTFSVTPVGEPLRGAAVLTGDGTRLYATGGNGILVVDTHTLSKRAQYLVDRQFASVIVSSDGTRLYTLGTDGAITRVEPGTGRDLGLVARLPNAVAIVRIE